jgi:SDR family mycofactocin-dependent oxidoreductase
VHRFTNKVVLITGAARGQGRSHAVGFAREGADVVACDLTADVATVPYGLGTVADLDETKKLVEAEDRRCLTLRADVRDADQLAHVVDATLTEFGHIDVLVANAGIASISTIATMSDEVWQTMLDINLTGVFKSMRAVIPHMVKRGQGRIVATSSIVGRQGSPNIAHYVAAKWGVIGLVKSAALELADKGITVNCVAPTSVGTKMILNQAFEELFLPDVPNPTKQQVEDAYTALNPIPVPWLQPEDVTNAVLFLASDEARYITGEALSVAAGWNARNAS